MANDQDDPAATEEPVSGADMDLSSLAGMNQPLEGGGMGPPAAANLPGGIAAPQGAPAPAPGLQPRPVPTVSQQAKAHGGLLSGLAGVLLDGLSGGMIAQSQAPLYGAPGSNFARGFVTGQNMDVIKQQKQQQMWDSLTKVEQDKALMGKSYVDQLTTHMQSLRLSDDVVSGMMDSDRQMADQAIEEGWGTRLSVTSGANARADAMNQVHDLRLKDTAFKGQYFAYPLNHDGQGHATEWQVVKIDPDATLKQDQTISYPAIDPITGEPSTGSFVAHAGMNVRQFIAMREAMIKGAASAIPGEIKSAEKQMTDRILTQDENGNAIVLARFQAASRGLSDTGKALSPQNELKINESHGQFGLVQKQLSLYKNAVQDVNALPENVRQADATKMLAMLQESKEAGVFKGSLTVPTIGKLDLPVVGALQGALDDIFKTKEFASMSRESQALWRSYRFMLPQLNLYNRVVEDSARAVGQPGMVETEKQTVPTPYDFEVNPAANLPYLENWQDNMNLVNKEVPGGMDNLNSIRRQTEHGFGAPTVDWSKMPKGATGIGQGKKGWYWVDANGKPVAPYQ